MLNLFSKPAQKRTDPITRIDVKALYERLETQRRVAVPSRIPVVAKVKPAEPRTVAPPVLLPTYTDSQVAIMKAIEETLADIG